MIYTECEKFNDEKSNAKLKLKIVVINLELMILHNYHFIK